MSFVSEIGDVLKEAAMTAIQVGATVAPQIIVAKQLPTTRSSVPTAPPPGYEINPDYMPGGIIGEQYQRRSTPMPYATPASFVGALPTIARKAAPYIGGALIGEALEGFLPAPANGFGGARPRGGIYVGSLHHVTPYGRVVPNRVSAMPGPDGNLDFFVHAGNPTGFSKISFKKRRCRCSKR